MEGKPWALLKAIDISEWPNSIELGYITQAKFNTKSPKAYPNIIGQFTSMQVQRAGD